VILAVIVGTVMSYSVQPMIDYRSSLLSTAQIDLPLHNI
jgi:hypothetical protein